MMDYSRYSMGRNIKIAHECPLSIFDHIQSKTDYDYALVHLFEESPEYYSKFENALKNGREVILDNSIFELGTAWDSDRFAYWVNRLLPTWYIIPDVLDNKDGTIESFEKFEKRWPNLQGKRIAVAQGSSYEELVECYNYFKNHSRVDKIGLSFNHPFYQEMFAEESSNKYEAMVKGRQWTINQMLANNIINKDKPHHLLGCGLPQEFEVYRFDSWIDSLDTSNPVLHGLLDIQYEKLDDSNTYGLTDKKSVKMFTLINEKVVDKLSKIDYNIDKFRKNLEFK